MIVSQIDVSLVEWSSSSRPSRLWGREESSHLMTASGMFVILCLSGSFIFVRSTPPSSFSIIIIISTIFCGYPVAHKLSTTNYVLFCWNPNMMSSKCYIRHIVTYDLVIVEAPVYSVNCYLVPAASSLLPPGWCPHWPPAWPDLVLFLTISNQAEPPGPLGWLDWQYICVLIYFYFSDDMIQQWLTQSGLALITHTHSQACQHNFSRKISNTNICCKN